MNDILDRFLRYVAIDTQSDPESGTYPSTARQLDLLGLLCRELNEMGIRAEMSGYGVVMGTVPSNCGGDIPPVGFIAHADTSPDAPGKDVRPRVIRNYQGGNIALEGGCSIKTDDFPELEDYRGQTIITASGDTLLGADDKAGIAEIMDAMQYIMKHPEFRHGEIRIAFTPDEEVGRGTEHFDVENFGAKYAYTVDGGAVGELEYENFNAASATVSIHGRNIHPGSAKGKMLNAMLVGMELNAMLPADQRPECTEGYEGFFHLTGFEGIVERAQLSYIIRDHDSGLYEEKKEQMKRCVGSINEKYGSGTAEVKIKHQYSNMKKEIEPHMHIVDIAVKAMEMEEIIPKIQPIRGGTDGANLSYMGLPCPNIFTGGHNFHGRQEFIPLESMQKASKVILNIISLFAGNSHLK